MFVKPRDVPPLLCFNVQTEMRFGVEQLLFLEGMRCKQERQGRLHVKLSCLSEHVRR